MKFAYKLQELRKGSGMSQEEFAELLGVSRQSVSKWESGKGYPEIDKLIFISNYFNTSLDLLLKDTSNCEDSSSILKDSQSVKSSNSTPRKTIKLTKPEDIDNFNNQTTYISEPIPNKKKENYPIERVSISTNTQVRPIKNHTFGKKRKKINFSKIGQIVVGTILVASIIIPLGMSSRSNVDYEDSVATTSDAIDIEDNYISPAEEYDQYGVDWLDYGITWETLYDDDLTSTYEQKLLNDMDNISDITQLVDTEGNIYYTSYEALATYQEAEYRMKTELNCTLLYQKYIAFKGYKNCTFKELYSLDMEEWVIINTSMLNKYMEGNDPSLIPDYNNMYFDDILDTPSEYSNENTAPFEVVFRIDKESKASVPTNILNSCSYAMNDRKSKLTMQQYISTYEDFNSKYELVNYRKSSVTFVPKVFVTVPLTDTLD
ncbi:MAG: helix-turn-helix transcriptional regulator [Ruminococcus sp.]|nr:helix-turn-helix transcriptional regulator [Ruminococcus sp.]